MGFVVKKSLKIGQIGNMKHKLHLAIFLEFGYFSQFCSEWDFELIFKHCEIFQIR